MEKPFFFSSDSRRKLSNKKRKTTEDAIALQMNTAHRYTQTRGKNSEAVISPGMRGRRELHRRAAVTSVCNILNIILYMFHSHPTFLALALALARWLTHILIDSFSFSFIPLCFPSPSSIPHSDFEAFAFSHSRSSVARSISAPQRKI